MNALAASLANRSELWRASCPITTPLEAMFGRPWMYLASPCDAWITVKEFIQENPAAIRPRRPAVPNSIPDVQSDVYFKATAGSTYDCVGAAPARRWNEHHATALFPHEWWDPISESMRSRHQEQGGRARVPGPTGAMSEPATRLKPTGVSAH